MCKSPLYAYRALHLTTYDNEPCYVWDSEVQKSVLKYFPKGICVSVWSSDIPPKFKFLPFEKWQELKEVFPENDYFRIPCGQCIDCRLRYSKEWASRITCESALYENNLFVTLTYDDEHLPRSKVCPTLSTLDYRDLQLFLKRFREALRRDFDFSGVRYYAAGEYGDTSQRAHFHICFFNLPYQLMEQLRYYKTSFCGDIYTISDYIQKIWGKGIVVCGDLNFQSAAYVARYVCKKMKGSDKLEELKKLGLANQESRMSLKPGIGADYFHLFKDDIYKNDEMFLPAVGRVCVSRYFDKLMDLDNPIFLAELKAKRAVSAERVLRSKLSQTDKDELSMLASELEFLKNRVKCLVRPEI